MGGIRGDVKGYMDDSSEKPKKFFICRPGHADTWKFENLYKLMLGCLDFMSAASYGLSRNTNL